MDKIRKMIRSKTNEWRNIDYVFHQTSMDELWDNLLEVEKNEVSKSALDGDYETLKKLILIYEKKYTLVESLSVHELRRRAIAIGIRRYTYMPKAMLISKIRESLIRNNTVTY